MTEPETVVGEEVEEIEPADPPVVTNAVAVREQGSAMVAQGEISVEQLLAQSAKIQEAMTLAMREGHHYGTIPGTQKPTLLKPGAEKLCVLFRLAPKNEQQVTWHDDGHMTAISSCSLVHIPTGLTIATGEGLCTTRESRYAFRKGSRLCPECEAPQIKKSKFAPKQGDYDYGDGRDISTDPPGWYCWRKEGGCGANFAHDDPRITEQNEDRIANPDLADTYNTVLKMSGKRAFVDAVLKGTAASEVFTQDTEDGGDGAGAPAAAGQAVKLTLRVDAPKGWGNIVKAFEAAGVYDSPLWGAEALKRFYGVEKRTELGDQSEYGIRLANAAARLLEITEGREMPPAEMREIRQAFSEAFDGLILDGPPAPAPGESIPDDPETTAAIEQLEAERLDAAPDAVLTPEESAAMQAALENDDVEFGDKNHEKGE